MLFQCKIDAHVATYNFTQYNESLKTLFQEIHQSGKRINVEQTKFSLHIKTVMLIIITGKDETSVKRPEPMPKVP